MLLSILFVSLDVYRGAEGGWGFMYQEYGLSTERHVDSCKLVALKISRSNGKAET